MTTVAQAFEALRQSLELTDSQREEASRQQNVVRENLRRGLGERVQRDFLTGSYKRRTAIRPLKDIDLFVVLDVPVSGWDGTPKTTPQQVLSEVQRVLAQAYPTKDKPKLQTRSVNIDFTGTGIGFDVVPAVASNNGGYHIPDRSAGAWIRSDPERHEEVLQKANGNAGGKLNPLVKMLKCWRRVQQPPVSSFHLEVMACRPFTGMFRDPAPADFPSGLVFLFEKLSDAVGSSCVEPAGVGPPVDAGLSAADRERARQMLRGAADLARGAQRFGLACDTAGAHRAWRALLGEFYVA